jgi:L-threonylcarbamoyladenylate synthase
MILDGRHFLHIQQAAQRLADGDLVAFPTETVYGLGARADDDAAVARIFEAKGRPSDHPLIVHVPDTASARHFAADWPLLAQQLADAFWPGPLTLILPRRRDLAEAAAGGQASVGLRCPAHPVAVALLNAAQDLGVRGVAAPSANRFGRVSPTTARHVSDEFDEALWVLDGGPCPIGIESTIVDCTRAQPTVLRPGMLTSGEIESVVGQPLGEPDRYSPKASGTLEAHYAPSAKLRLMTHKQLEAALQILGPSPVKLGVYARSALHKLPSEIQLRQMPNDAAAAAHELFAVLREFDERGQQIIWVEEPPSQPPWDGVRDRLIRASAASEAATQ